ncbi:hypothetical protein WA556_006557, partial [Blastocystis sp. ATCC 50177/Nand II]
MHLPPILSIPRNGLTKCPTHRSIPRRRSLRANRHASPFSPSRFFWALCSLAPSTSEWLLMFPRLLHAPSVLPHVPSAVSCIEIGGILGTLWCGYVSDAYHLSRAHICEAASILAGIVFAALPWASSPLAFLLLGFLLGFFLYIPFSFSELIAMESVDARLASTVISLNGLMSPFGSVFSGLPVDWVIRTFGWECLPFLVPLCFCAFSLLLWTNHLVQRRLNERK